MKEQVDSSSRGQKDFICREEKRRERLHGSMQGDPETGDLLGQAGNWVFISFFYCLRAEMSVRGKQKFPEKKFPLGQLSPFGTSCSGPSILPLSDHPNCC
jgi:hypothetical protein